MSDRPLRSKRLDSHESFKVLLNSLKIYNCAEQANMNKNNGKTNKAKEYAFERKGNNNQERTLPKSRKSVERGDMQRDRQDPEEKHSAYVNRFKSVRTS